jgi:kynurenine formamidase
MWLQDFHNIVTAGKIIELSHVLTMDMPHSPNHPPFMFRLTKLHGDAKDSDIFTVSSDMFTMGSHNGTHMDGLGHVGCCGIVYGGVHGDTVSTRRGGFEGIGIETAGPFFCRGVLLDVPLLHGGESLPPAYEISKTELMEVAAIEGVDIREGDAVLIRSGWERYWSDNRKYVGLQEGGPGPSKDSAIWLGDKRIRATGADTFAYDKRPSNMPCHIEFMVNRNIHIMENLRLDELAQDKIYEFMFCALPLRIQGGTGSPIRAIALY